MPRLTPELAPKSSPFTIRYFMTSQDPGSGQRLPAVPPWLIRAQGVAQDLCRGLLSVEIGLGQSSRRRAVVLVIGVDRVERPGRLLRRRETEHPLAIREELARTGALAPNRFAARQVARRTVAHPCILKLDAGTLDAAELAARPLDVGLVHLGGRGHLPRPTDPPTAPLHFLSLRQVSLALQKQGQLQRLRRESRQIRVFEKRDAFRVLILLGPIHDPIGRIPDGDRRERFASRVVPVGPIAQR